jgi:uncharacterized protein YecT (DUF1311 family)
MKSTLARVVIGTAIAFGSFSSAHTREEDLPLAQLRTCLSAARDSASNRTDLLDQRYLCFRAEFQRADDRLNEIYKQVINVHELTISNLKKNNQSEASALIQKELDSIKSTQRNWIRNGRDNPCKLQASKYQQELDKDAVGAATNAICLTAITSSRADYLMLNFLLMAR